jgi:hypothetical protein
MASVVVAGLVLFIVFFVLAHAMDQDRIQEYVEQRGGYLLQLSWDPLGPGWFGDESNRVYRVRYVSADGATHEAHAKTGFFTGVYFTNDEVTDFPVAPERRTIAELEAENRRLREQLARGAGGRD